MGRTARLVLGTGAIAALFALTPVVADAVPAAPGVTLSQTPAPAASRLDSAEATAPRADDERGSWRGFVELLILAVTCSVVVAFYTTTGERGGTRVPARVRRR
jgi:hypothetical protein